MFFTETVNSFCNKSGYKTSTAEQVAPDKAVCRAFEETDIFQPN